MKTIIKALTIKVTMASMIGMLVSGSTALADTWCHDLLKATDGTEIQIDYQIGQESPMRMPTYWAMKNVYVHVKNKNFTGSEAVSVVFTTAVNGRRPDWSRVAHDVPYDGDRYTASGGIFDRPFTSLIRPTGWNGGGASYHFEVAIVVDGHWLVDPVSTESNFKFFADQYHNLCANPY